MTLSLRILKMSTKESASWYKNLEHDEEYIAEKLKYAFALDIERLMHHYDINKTQLAKRIHSSPSYVTKVLRGDANPTVETMTKLTHAIGGTLHIHVALAHFEVKWIDVWTNKTLTEATDKSYTDVSSGSIWAKQTTKKKFNYEQIAIGT